tara:strand:- start:98 stop:1267 length:1170 start_codon:yes stop_codon:yes gene_type:complete
MAELPSPGLDTESIARDLNQVIFEREFDPRLSLAENFQKIVDAARNKSEYKSKDFDPLGVSSATQLRRFSASDVDKPKLKAILGNTSITEVATQYDAPLVGNYDVKSHLLNFLSTKQKQSNESIDEDLDRIEFADGDVAELPDVGSIQPLTEAEKRKAFGTPLTRALKMDPISLERSPIKRGIASIGSNMLDMLPGFSLQKGMQEGDPIQMGLGVTDLLPGAALLKVGSKAVTDLANKLARMAPEDIAAVKQQYNPVFRNIYEQQERIINAPNANPADVADALEKQRKINANYSIMFDNAGKKFNPDKAVGKKSFIGEEFNPVELETGYDSLQEYMHSIVRYPGPIPFDPDLKKQIIKYIQDNPQKVESIALRKKLQRTDLDDAIDSLD